MTWNNQTLLIKEAQAAAGTAADGKWGPNTERAIEKVFEAAHGMPLLDALISQRDGDEPPEKIIPLKEKTNVEYPTYDIPWLVVADTFEGVSEVAGSGDNPLIVKMAQETGNKWIKKDSVAWCSTSMCYVMLKAGYDHTASAAARSWEKYGIKCDLAIGAIAVFDRSRPGNPKTSWWRHVGLVRKIYDSNTVALQGGNQSDKYCTKRYKLTRLKELRCPAGWKSVNGVLRKKT